MNKQDFDLLKVGDYVKSIDYSESKSLQNVYKIVYKDEDVLSIINVFTNLNLSLSAHEKKGNFKSKSCINNYIVDYEKLEVKDIMTMALNMKNKYYDVLLDLCANNKS